MIGTFDQQEREYLSQLREARREAEAKVCPVELSEKQVEVLLEGKGEREMKEKRS